MNANTLPPDLLDKMDASRRASHYLSVDQMYLDGNPLLKRPPALADVTHRRPGWQGAGGARYASEGGAAHRGWDR